GTVAGAEQQLAGTFIDPATGELYPNEANLNFTTGWVVNPVNVPGVINWEQDALSAGNFTDLNGFQDVFIPGIPGNFQSTDGVAAEMLTFLELPKGLHTLGVNSDDGFRVTSGASAKGPFGTVLGQFNGTRGSADSLFDIVVREEGIYPIRLLYFEAGGGANLEFFSVVDGEKILINDSSNANSIKAYREGPNLPFVSGFIPSAAQLTSTVEITLEDDEISVDQGSIQLSIDGENITADVSKSGGTTTINYDNGDFFTFGDHSVILTYDAASDPVLTLTSNFTLSIPTGQVTVLLDGPNVYLTLGNVDGGLTDASIGTDVGGADTRGTLNGTTNPTLVDRLVVGAPDGALSFDREQAQYIALADNPFINDSPSNPGTQFRTYEMWFQARNLPKSSNDIVEQTLERQILYEGGGTTRGTSIYLDGSQPDDNPTEATLHFMAWNMAQEAWGGTNAGLIIDGTTDISTTIQAGVTYHIAYVMEGDTIDFNGTMTAYVNGEMVGQSTGMHLLYDATDDIGIGASRDQTAFHDFAWSLANGDVGGGLIVPADFAFTNPGFFFDGIVDEFAVYDGLAFTAEMAKNHYDQGLIPVDLAPVSGGGDPEISISTDADGNIVLTFGRTLLGADSVEGPYGAVDGASSPQTVTPDQQRRFYQAGN
ncbi:MAG TPA: hypothetical protein EYG38_18240, partial [Verrucomicrobia bacterium]|nr:hypothetical protein [Verrucomicrobiota bacterium]